MSVDTLSLAKELRAAELSGTQAEAIATAIGRAVIEGAATRADLQLTKNELKADIQQIKSELETKIEQVRTTMMTWSVATILSVAAVIVAVVKL